MHHARTAQKTSRETADNTAHVVFVVFRCLRM